ncbi:hypothetical protein MRX96_016246 [Rhipicephalus microplus]
MAARKILQRPPRTTLKLHPAELHLVCRRASEKRVEQHDTASSNGAAIRAVSCKCIAGKDKSTGLIGQEYTTAQETNYVTPDLLCWRHRRGTAGLLRWRVHPRSPNTHASVVVVVKHKQAHLFSPEDLTERGARCDEAALRTLSPRPSYIRSAHNRITEGGCSLVYSTRTTVRSLLPLY